MQSKQKAGAALAAAFPHTIPILASFLFLGMTYGVLMQAKGYGAVWSLLMSLVVFAGGIQFAAIGLLSGPFHPLQALLLSLVVNARHLFYGISLLKKYKGIGKSKPFLIYTMCDETFSVVSSVTPAPDVDRAWFYFWICLLNYFYWVCSSFLGGILGSLISLDIKGLDFALTALFVVLFLEQWKEKSNRIPALIGLACSGGFLVLLGPDHFIIPAMGAMQAALTLARGKLEGIEDKNAPVTPQKGEE